MNAPAKIRKHTAIPDMTRIQFAIHSVIASIFFNISVSLSALPILIKEKTTKTGKHRNS